MAIKDWPQLEQPIERLLVLGERVLSDAEILAVLIGRGVPGLSAIDIGKKLIDEHKSLRAALKAINDPNYRAFGIGRTTKARIRAGVELTRRIAKEKVHRMEPLQSPEEVVQFLTLHYLTRRREVVSAFYLDSRNRVLAAEDLFFGTLDCASIHPREIVRSAIINEAVAVIMAHNHPSGIAQPSEADRIITQRVKRCLELIEIQLLDHLVIGEGEFSSLARLGLL